MLRPAQIAFEPALRPKPEPEPDAAPALPPPTNVVETNNTFAVRLFGELSHERGNLFFSPTSIMSALALTYAGAKGETAREMEQALSLFTSGEQLHQELGRTLGRLVSSRASGGPSLLIANRLWPARQLALEPSFVQLAQRYYGAAPEQLDFAKHEGARQRVNKWIEQRTEQMIPELLGPGDVGAGTALVLSNAVYFKGQWATMFEKQHTKLEPFTPETGPARPIPLMHYRLMKASHAYTRDAQVLELPYRASAKGPHLALAVILPKEPTGLVDLERRLVKEGLSGYLTNVRETRVDVTLPRFEVAWSSSLKPALQALGMRQAFEEHADLSGLATGSRLLIDVAQHEAVVKVNEEGTQAAAATRVTAVPVSLHYYPEFRADRPFLFLVRDVDTGVVLFLGRFSQPR